ncbi:MAG: hypothetical protein ACREOO_06620, partial [bacterium]
GEFLAAEKLLEQRGFPLSKEEEIKEKLYTQLQKERRQRLEELNLRCWLIAERIDDADLAKKLIEAKHIGSRSMAKANYLLDEIETQLAEESNGQPKHEIIYGPLLSVWPYTHEPMEKICQWFLRGAAASAPRGFNREWGPPSSDDFPAWKLLGTLSLLASSAAAIDPDTVANFGDALTRFLTGYCGTSEPAERRDGFYWTKLRGLGSVWLPAPMAQHGMDWPLAIPDPASPSPSSADALKNLIITFDPWEAVPQKPKGTLILTPALMFRLIRNPETRLEAFLYKLGQQIPLTQALPQKLPNLDHPPIREGVDEIAGAYLTEGNKSQPTELKRSQIYDFLSRFLGYLGVESGSPHEDMQRLLYYGGKNPKQLRVFLRRILRRLEHPKGKRRNRLTRRTIEETWFDPLFRRKAQASLLADLRDNPLQRLILALLIYELLTSANSFVIHSMHIDDLVGNLKARGIKFEKQVLEKCLNELEESGFIEKNPETTRYGLASDGTRIILCEAIARSDKELDKFIESAISELMSTSK